MKALESIWTWLKRWGLALAGLLALVLGGGFLMRRQIAALGRAKDEAAVSEARREIDALRATRTEVASRTEEKSEQITALDARIRDVKREIIDLHEGGELIPDDQLDDAFAHLGY